MTFQEAVQCAETIKEESPDCLVIAIGRFVPVEQITPKTSWKLSVCIDGKRQIIQTRAECESLIAASKPTKSAPVGMLF